MGPHSDVDLLVIADVKDRSAVTGCIHRRLRGEHAAVDAIVVTPADVARYRNSHALIIKPALQEGRVVYETRCPRRLMPTPSLSPRRSFDWPRNRCDSA